MKDGYYYFQSIENEKSTDKSLGYICIRKNSQNNDYFMQISFTHDKIRSLVSGNIIDIYISPTHYITNGSHLISRLSYSAKSKLFVDVRIPEIYFNIDNDSHYIIATCNNRTILYSEIYKKVATDDNILLKNSRNPVFTQENTIQENNFDPFNTTNKSYEWKIIEKTYIDDINITVSSNDLAKYFENLNISYDRFSKMIQGSKILSHDTFLKMALSAFRISGHLLIGKYTDLQSNKIFNILGLPGINIIRNIKKKRNSVQNIPPLHNYARWMFAINKPVNSFKSNFNGYWLYYFNSESGNPVKPVIMTQ